LVIRNFEADDIKKILALYERTLCKSNHFIRDETFIRYFMRFPGVNKNSVFVAESNGNIVGFAVLSIVHEKGAKIGLVLELQCENNSSFHDLIQVIHEYCVNQEVDAITLTLPPSINSSSILKGWLKVETGTIMVKPNVLLPLLQAIFSKSELLELIGKKKIIFHLGNETLKASFEGVQKLTREADGFKCQRSVEIFLSSKTLLKIIFNGRNPLVEWLIGRIKVRSIRNIPFAFKVLRKLRLKDGIYVSLADRV
jgi:hypothetical protein